MGVLLVVMIASAGELPKRLSGSEVGSFIAEHHSALLSVADLEGPGATVTNLAMVASLLT